MVLPLCLGFLAVFFSFLCWSRFGFCPTKFLTFLRTSHMTQPNYSILSLLAVLILGGCAALHVIPSKSIMPLEFDRVAEHPSLEFIYQTPENSPELIDLNHRYRLDSVWNQGSGEIDRVLQILNWTHTRWEHDGSNPASESKTLVILAEAEAGERFRCVEYGLVLRSALASQGMMARTLGLKTRDVEVTRLGAGHVLTEVWSSEFQKWFLADGQFNVVPIAEGVPLNAVELQEAIVGKREFQLVDAMGPIAQERRERYLDFIPHYLYHFDFKFDQRELPLGELTTNSDKTFLMLVPKGSKNPSVFQRKSSMDYLLYTHSLGDFYRAPIPMRGL